jgi:hypothetical protein
MAAKGYERENMKRYLLLLAILQISLASVLGTQFGLGESYYLKLYPAEGTVRTNIVLRAFVPPGSNNWVYWDDMVIARNIPYDDQIIGFTLNISCPNESPYSDLGNHTVTVESFYMENGSRVAYFNATFEIIEYLPTSEYLSLNATYYSLLANYSELLDNYNSLLINYTALTDSNNDLFSNYTILLSNYNSIAANYNSLLADYNALTSNFNLLFTKYDSLSGNYEGLRSLYSLFLANYSALLGSYESLNSNYNALKGDYNSLNSSYLNLETNYSSLTNELSSARMLNYAFIGATIMLVALVVYLIMRKPKPMIRSR